MSSLRALPPTVGAATGVTGAARMAELDPPGPPGPNGWTPATRRNVESTGGNGFLDAGLHFIDKPPTEPAGQRLSTAMVDEYAPFFARMYQLDEGFVRRLLSEVYLYVGGVAHGGDMAVTNGTHVFVPTAQAMDSILSPTDGGRRWLTHELAHTLQGAAFDGGNPVQSLGRYGRGVAIGRNPERPGSSAGPLIWGSLVTGQRIIRDTERDPVTGRSRYTEDAAPGTRIGEASLTARDRLQFSLVPAAVVGTGAGIFAGGVVDAARYIRPATEATGGMGAVRLPSHPNGWLTGMALVTAPVLAGGAAGFFGDSLGALTGPVGALGGAAAAGAGLATLRYTLRNGAVAQGGVLGWAPVAAGAVLGAMQGYAVAKVSANTTGGWSDSAELLSMRQRVSHPPSGFAEAIHDAHWMEIDAEAAAREHAATRGTPIDASPFAGREPAPSSRLDARVSWAVTNPLLVGVPAAAVAGTGVLVTRGLTNAISGVGRGQSLLGVIPRAFAQLATRHQGLMNSFGVGAALTAIPLLTGGIASSAMDGMGLSRDNARAGGAAAAAAVTGAQLTWLLGRNPAHRSLVQLSPKVVAGSAVAAAVGYLAASAATSAAHPVERTYVTPRPTGR